MHKSAKYFNIYTLRLLFRLSIEIGLPSYIHWKISDGISLVSTIFPSRRQIRREREREREREGNRECERKRERKRERFVCRRIVGYKYSVHRRFSLSLSLSGITGKFFIPERNVSDAYITFRR